MRLTLPHGQFNSLGKRLDLACMLHLFIEGRAISGIPYNPNEADTHFWTLDSGNDWKLRFFNDQPDTIEVSYRYGGEKEQAFAYWLQFRLRAEIHGPGLSYDDDLGHVLTLNDGRKFTLRSSLNGSPAWIPCATSCVS